MEMQNGPLHILCSALLCAFELTEQTARAQDPGGIALDNPTGAWQNLNNQPFFHVELFGTFTPPAVTKIEIYRKVNNGAYQLASTAVIAVGPPPSFSDAQNFSPQFVGDTLTFYAKLYYVDQGVAKTKDSSEKSITVTAVPKGGGE
jgi:hypothetical protein